MPGPMMCASATAEAVATGSRLVSPAGGDIQIHDTGHIPKCLLPRESSRGHRQSASTSMSALSLTFIFISCKSPIVYPKPAQVFSAFSVAFLSELCGLKAFDVPAQCQRIHPRLTAEFS